MSEWDGPNNIERYPPGACQKCGNEEHCVCSDGLEDEPDWKGKPVCTHCYDVITGQDECDLHMQDGDCIGCKYYDPSRDE